MSSNLNVSYTDSEIFPVEREFIDNGGITGISVKKHKIFVKRYPSEAGGSYDNTEIISESEFNTLKQSKQDFQAEATTRITDPPDTSEMSDEEITASETAWNTKVEQHEYELEEIPIGLSNIEFTSFDDSKFELIQDDNENKLYNLGEKVKTETEELTCDNPITGMDIYKSKITSDSDDIINKIGVICDGERKTVGYDKFSDFRTSKICDAGKNITFLKFNGKDLNINENEAKMTIVNSFDDIRCYELDKSKYDIEIDFNKDYTPPDYFPKPTTPSFINNIFIASIVILIIGFLLSSSISIFVSDKKTPDVSVKE